MFAFLQHLGNDRTDAENEVRRAICRFFGWYRLVKALAERFADDNVPGIIYIYRPVKKHVEYERTAKHNSSKVLAPYGSTQEQKVEKRKTKIDAA